MADDSVLGLFDSEGATYLDEINHQSGVAEQPSFNTVVQMENNTPQNISNAFQLNINPQQSNNTQSMQPQTALTFTPASNQNQFFTIGGAQVGNQQFGGNQFPPGTKVVHITNQHVLGGQGQNIITNLGQKTLGNQPHNIIGVQGQNVIAHGQNIIQIQGQNIIRSQGQNIRNQGQNVLHVQSQNTSGTPAQTFGSPPQSGKPSAVFRLKSPPQQQVALNQSTAVWSPSKSSSSQQLTVIQQPLSENVASSNFPSHVVSKGQQQIQQFNTLVENSNAESDTSSAHLISSQSESNILSNASSNQSASVAYRTNVNVLQQQGKQNLTQQQIQQQKIQQQIQQQLQQQQLQSQVQQPSISFQQHTSEHIQQQTPLFQQQQQTQQNQQQATQQFQQQTQQLQQQQTQQLQQQQTQQLQQQQTQQLQQHQQQQQQQQSQQIQQQQTPQLQRQQPQLIQHQSQLQQQQQTQQLQSQQTHQNKQYQQHAQQVQQQAPKLQQLQQQTQQLQQQLQQQQAQQHQLQQQTQYHQQQQAQNQHQLTDQNQSQTQQPQQSTQKCQLQQTHQLQQPVQLFQQQQQQQQQQQPQEIAQQQQSQFVYQNQTAGFQNQNFQGLEVQSLSSLQNTSNSTLLVQNSSNLNTSANSIQANKLQHFTIPSNQQPQSSTEQGISGTAPVTHYSSQSQNTNESIQIMSQRANQVLSSTDSVSQSVSSVCQGGGSSAQSVTPVSVNAGINPHLQKVHIVHIAPSSNVTSHGNISVPSNQGNTISQDSTRVIASTQQTAIQSDMTNAQTGFTQLRPLNPVHQQNILNEIQQLQQQLQQLSSIPQTSDSVQKIADLQEKIRAVRNRQQQVVHAGQQSKVQMIVIRPPNQQGNTQTLMLRLQSPGSTQGQHVQIQPHMSVQVPNQSQQATAVSQQLIMPVQPSVTVGTAGAITSQIATSVASCTPQKIHLIIQKPSSTSTLTTTTLTTISPSSVITTSVQPSITTNPHVTAVSSVSAIPVTSEVSSPSKPPLSEEQKAAAEEKKKRKREQAKARRLVKQQEKANRIIAEAVAKAQAAGNDDIPRVVSAEDELEINITDIPCEPLIDFQEEEVETNEKKKKKGLKKKKKAEKEVKSKTSKPKSSKKKKPPATLMKKKRKKGNVSDGSDIDISPPHSPVDEDLSVIKRRSGRHTQRKKYLDDIDIKLSDEDENQDVDIEGVDNGVAIKTEEESLIVEKILGMRTRKVDKEDEEDMRDADGGDEIEEFFVKYKNYSYLHCDWKSLSKLEKGDKRVQSKIKRYRVKKLQMNSYFSELDDEEFFNPDYVEVERVLDVSVTIDPVTQEEVTHYIVKWRSLAYEDSTWELQQDVDPKKVELFYKYREPPDEDEREVIGQPHPSEWLKLPESRTYKNNNTVREYQLEGVNWLTFCWYNGQNCILADEMGLGKTIQSITFLLEMYYYGVKGPYLVIVPLSTLGNWQREFESWTDMNVIIYHGTTISKSMIQEYEMFYKDSKGRRIPDIYKFNALVTTYEVIISDCELLSNIEWRCVIIDEAHRLKNKNCRLMEGLKMFDMEHRVLLTGTPLQNNTEELFSLLNFLEPNQFSSSEAFCLEFGNLKSEEQVDKLKQILKPMMLRRLKEDVEKNLAPKEETIVEVELTNIQKKYYRAILERNFSFLAKGSSTSANVPNLMNTMMELRKCCNHPFLITGAEEQIVTEAKIRHNNDIEQIFISMVQSSGKMVLLDKLLPKLKENGHRVLIFSQMIRVLDILEDYLHHRMYLYERLDGRIRGNIRQEAIDRFSKPDSDRFVFLLCTRAGGLGINLTAADTVIIYDSDWNPQNDLQAQARCHRIGQSKAVKVYRLITRNSYEREMFDRASLKLGLDKAVLQNMADKPTNPQSQLTKKEIEDLLRKGAYGALMEDDGDGDKFCEEDIDQILQRRTQVVQIEAGEKGSTFAKASFSMSDNRNDIDINDPNFWQKWAKKAEVDTDNKSNELIMEVPRQRKQTTRYGNNDSILDMSELESSSGSDDEDKTKGEQTGPGKKGKKRSSRRGRGRRRDDEDFEGEEYTGDGYHRSELFKVEKNLLVFGWGRWTEIIYHAKFKRKLTDDDVKTISRALLLYSLQHYKGDERIKEFIWDLVSPTSDRNLKNHSGLSAPVPRGRKGRKIKEKGKTFSAADELEKGNLDLDPEEVLNDVGYKRHLHRHSNKVLLRVRLLYYLEHEVIGDAAEKIKQGLVSTDIHIPPPAPEGDPPTPWWDLEADRCLLMGVYKHGYEKYNLMRQDPCLVFLQHCGPPDGAALLAEQNDDDYNDNQDFDVEDKGDIIVNEEEEEDLMNAKSEACSMEKTLEQQALYNSEAESGKGRFPTIPEINTRLRRIITGYQRNYKKNLLKSEQMARKTQRREIAETVLKEREYKRKEFQQNKWSRREESDFYRCVSTFGVEYHPATGRYFWDKFRSIAKLDKKFDDTLTEYYQAFYYMCQRVCRKFQEDEAAKPPNCIFVEPITEERASRCLARIDLLSKVREVALQHPQLDERVKLCQSAFDMPSWWKCGQHDKELLIGVAKHGLTRTDLHIMQDPDFSFLEVIQAKLASITNTLTQMSKSMKDEESRDALIKSELIRNDMEIGPLNLKKEIKEEVKEEKVDSKDDFQQNEDQSCDGENSKKQDDIKTRLNPDKDFQKVTIIKTEDLVINGDVKAEDDQLSDKEDAKADVPENKEIARAAVDKGKSVKEETENKITLEIIPDQDSDMEMREYINRGGYPSNPALEWPKDRVIFHRLEHICFTVEHGEWPFSRKTSFISSCGMDSRSETPVGPSTPKHEHSTGDSESITDVIPGEGLKLTFHRRAQLESQMMKTPGKSRKKYDIMAEKVLQLQAMRDSANSSDNDSMSEPFGFSKDDYSSVDPDSPMFPQELLEQGLVRKGKRGRKRKAEKMAEMAMAEALARRRQAAALASLDDETPVPVLSIEDGSRLTGDEAPKKKDLENWMLDHPQYVVDLPSLEDDEDDEFSLKRRKKCQIDPGKVDIDNLSGDVNVSVLNRESGKKITGAKAPPLKHLAEWLEKNPGFDIDPKWAEIIKSKKLLPESLMSRLPTPSKRGRGRPRNERLPQALLSSGEFPFPVSSMSALAGLTGGGMMASFGKLPMGYPFGQLPGLGMTNPLLGMSALNIAGLTGLNAQKKDDVKDKDSSSADGKEMKSDSDNSSSLPHPSFPVVYNPLIFNPLLATQGLRNFQIPSNRPTSFAQLQTAGVNGYPESESDDDDKSKKKQKVHQAKDLSLKKVDREHCDSKLKISHSGSEKPQDLSMRNAKYQDTPTDLSIKKTSVPKDSKPKIFSSKKLNKIVDSLKDRVLKMEDRDCDTAIKDSDSVTCEEFSDTKSERSKSDDCDSIDDKRIQTLEQECAASDGSLSDSAS